MTGVHKLDFKCFGDLADSVGGCVARFWQNKSVIVDSRIQYIVSLHAEDIWAARNRPVLVLPGGQCGCSRPRIGLGVLTVRLEIEQLGIELLFNFSLANDGEKIGVEEFSRGCYLLDLTWEYFYGHIYILEDCRIVWVLELDLKSDHVSSHVRIWCWQDGDLSLIWRLIKLVQYCDELRWLRICCVYLLD